MSIYTKQELQWFKRMIAAGWMPKRVNSILSGVFFLWTHTETGSRLDERIYYNNIEVLGFHQERMTTPDPKYPTLGVVFKTPLFPPM